MASQARIGWLVTTIGTVALIVGCFGPPSPSRDGQVNADFAARYATNTFVATCRLRPKKLSDHALFGSLPFDRLLPDPLSLGRLETMGIEELVVFCGPADGVESSQAHDAQIEWAAVALASQPIDLQVLAGQWRRSLAPRPQPASPTAIQVDKYECFRFPAGSFFPPPRSYGRLRFTSRNGEPTEQGINVGYVYEHRGYLEGATNASAIFTLDHLDEADLIDDQLPLDLRPNVFHTRFNKHGYSVAQIELRNPASDLRSVPIVFKATSHVNHSLNLPRQITATDSAGERQVDLMQDLVSNGRLEIILKGTESGVYLGVGEHDLNVRPQASEYVFVAGSEIVVTQSLTTLRKMLDATNSPGTLATRLSESSGDIVVIANVRDNAQRDALQQLTRQMRHIPGAELWGDGLSELTATVDMAPRPAARISATFTDRRKAGKAMQQIKAGIRSTQDLAHANIADAVPRGEAMASLLSLGSNGIPMAFPRNGSPTFAERTSQLLAMIDSACGNLQVSSWGKAVTVKFTQPQQLDRLSEAAKFGLANMEEVYARDLIERERFDLGDEMYQRVTNRFPHVSEAWFHRAHQLAYNTSVQFDGEDRYPWVRRGIEVLLDGAEQNPDTTDLTWMAAKYIAYKIGDSDDRQAFRQLFSQDKRLQARIATVIDLEQTRSPDQQVDSWLVARLLFEHCIQRHETSGASSTIPPLLFYSQPAATQARYAQALSDAGHWADALRTWKEAEQLHKRLGDRTFITRSSVRIRLNDLDARLDEFGQDDTVVTLIRTARKRIQYDYRLTRCGFEQHANVQLARKRSHEAAKRAEQAEFSEAYELYRQALSALAEVHREDPSQMAMFAAELRHIATGYRQVAEQFGDGDDASLNAVLTLLEQSKPFSMLPLLNWHEVVATDGFNE